MTKEERDTLIAGLGLEYTAVFVPQSASRNSGEKNPSLNWCVTVRRHIPGRGPDSAHPAAQSIATDYMQGIGHLPKDTAVAKHHKGARRDSAMVSDYEHQCAESGKYGLFHSTRIPSPALADILYSLISDGDAADETFEEWCSNYGYDTDSRKAEQTYNACRETGRTLQRMFTRAELDQLREAFQDY